MATTEYQINSMRTMCERLKKHPLVKDAYVDDWGKFGNFSVFVTPKEHTRTTTFKLNKLVRSELPSGAMFRQSFPPDAVRERNYWSGKVKVVGYTRAFWSFDIDFNHYDAETNSFS